MDIKHVEIILFVEHQSVSTTFYCRLLRRDPDLFVPGMTEYCLSPFVKLGLMTNSGIARILTDPIPHPDLGIGIPRAELYLTVADPDSEYAHALACGAEPVSPVQLRDWGHTVGYVMDLDGHVIAFAKG